ncbi:hypothetical protein SBA1_90098 [Candidatus Sulfotelmatobacter kueseliae]|uniref:Uncharacterized protein n=1 Tax=Candidatus Sulfotelmatobacter kueseliae TaxID=2042962 RepID=A0A2U3LAJ2_9BACT|nr:hypothetical protein SBA1_90098 [Candidatus Sulfotelmatobacter kueseliae]
MLIAAQEGLKRIPRRLGHLPDWRRTEACDTTTPVSLIVRVYRTYPWYPEPQLLPIQEIGTRFQVFS